MDSKTMQAVILTCKAMIEAIESFGPRGVPSGELYANVMGTMSLDQYNNVIGVLVKTGFITNDHNLLRAR